MRLCCTVQTLTKMPAFFTARGNPRSPVPMLPFNRWIKVWNHLKRKERRHRQVNHGGSEGLGSAQHHTKRLAHSPAGLMRFDFLHKEATCSKVTHPVKHCTRIPPRAHAYPLCPGLSRAPGSRAQAGSRPSTVSFCF